MWTVIAVAIVIVANVILFIWVAKRRPSVAQWAAEHQLEVLESQHRILRRGPFWWTSGKDYVVYWVRAKDRDGATRSGFVRFGLDWCGRWTGESSVDWEQTE